MTRVLLSIEVTGGGVRALNDYPMMRDSYAFLVGNKAPKALNWTDIFYLYAETFILKDY